MREEMAQALWVTEQAEQTLRLSMTFEKEVMSRSTRRNKHKPLFQEALLGRRATMEVQDPNPPWSAREWEIIKKAETYSEQSERIWVAVKEIADSLLIPEEKMCIATLADLARDEGGYSKFLVDEKLGGTEVADAARFTKQARNERDDKETNRTAELRASQVSADKVSRYTKENPGAGRCDSAFRAENSIRDQKRDKAAQNSTKGSVEQNQDHSACGQVRPGEANVK